MNDNPLSIVEGRASRIPGLSYKLAGDSSGQSYGMDSLGAMDVDEANMSVWNHFADGHRRDGVGDLLEIGGIRTERHQGNPVVLYDHSKTISLPIALTEDKNKQYTVILDTVNQVGKANCFFYQGTGLDGVEKVAENEHAIFCEQLFDLIVKGYIRAGSIGYTVIKAQQLQPDYERGTPAGLHLLSVQMLECSFVVLPANGDTVRKALSLPRVCGKALSPVLVKSLQPYAAAAKAQMLVTQGNRLSDEMPPLPVEEKAKDDSGHEHDNNTGQFSSGGGKKPGKPVRRTPEQVSGGHGDATYRLAIRNGYSEEEANKLKARAADAAHTAFSNSTEKPTHHQEMAAAKLVGKIQDEIKQGGTKSLRLKYRKKGIRQIAEQDAASASREDLIHWLLGSQFQGRFTAQQLRDMGDSQLRQTYVEALMGKKTHDNPDNIPSAKWKPGLGAVKTYAIEAVSSTNTGTGKWWNGSDWVFLNQDILEHQNLEDAQRELSIVNQSGTRGRIQVIKSLKSAPADKLRGKIRSNYPFMSEEDKRKVEQQATAPKQPKIVQISKPFLTEVRQKYRQAKHYRRRLKKSSPGASNLHVAEKDLADVRAMAEKCGLKYQRMGSGEHGFEKVKLSGDDGAIDMVAQKFGKSLQTKTKGGSEEVTLLKPIEDNNGKLHSVGELGWVMRDGYYSGIGKVVIVDMQSGGMVSAKPDEIKREGTKSQPSADISPEKARQVLKDGEVHGHPLTDKQRAMFGAAAGKKSSPGASNLHVAEKDLADVRAMAEKCGLKYQRMGSGEHGFEKVKLSGDDGAIDMVAQKFGKSLQTKGSISNTIQVDNDYYPFRWEGDTLKAFIDGAWQTVRKTGRKNELGEWIFEIDKGKMKSQPSADISPEKAREVLKDGTVHGHPLTDKQRRLFGAAAGKDKGMKALGGFVIESVYDGKLWTGTRWTDDENQAKVYKTFEEANSAKPGGDAVIRKASDIFGNKGTNTMKTKAAPGVDQGAEQDVIDEELPGEEIPETKDYTGEPIGSQALRRVHEDHGLLMKDYDEIMGMLEPDSAVKDFMQGHLEGMEKALSEIEKLHSKHYKDLPKLEGAMDEEEKGVEDKEPVDEADSGEEEETPAEEVAAGMKEKALRLQQTKAARMRYGKKGMRLDAFQGYGPENRKFGYVHGDDGGFFFTWMPTLEETLESVEEDEVDGDGGLNESEVVNFLRSRISDKFKSMKAFHKAEDDDLEEAKSFLKALAEDGSKLDDEKKMLAFHHAKMLTKGETIGADADGHRLEVGDRVIVLDSPGGQKWEIGKTGVVGKKTGTNTVRVTLDDGSSLSAGTQYLRHAAGKSAAAVAAFLKALAMEKAFGNVHRQKALALVKAMEEEKALEPEDAAPIPEPGEMGEKRIALKKAFDQQTRNIALLSKSFDELVTRLN